MAEENKWLQNLDKVSYGAAAFLALVVLAIPLLSGSAQRDTAVDIARFYDDLENELAREFRKEATEPEWVAQMAAAWRVSQGSGASPAWISERAPVVVCAFEKAPPAKPQHVPGHIASIECDRDAAKLKPILKVSGKVSEKNHLVEVTKVVLLRKERTKEGESEFQEVPKFSATGDFEYVDEEVTPGNQYSYKIITHAEVQDGLKNVDLSEFRSEQESFELGPSVPVPYDFSFDVLGWGVDPLSPTVRARVQYWDYGQGKVVPERPRSTNYKEGDTFGFKDKSGTPRYLLRLIEADKVTIKDQALRLTSYELSRKEAKSRPVGCWAEPLIGEPATEPAADADAVVGEEAGADGTAEDGGPSDISEAPADGTTAGPTEEVPGTEEAPSGDGTEEPTRPGGLFK